MIGMMMWVMMVMIGRMRIMVMKVVIRRRRRKKGTVMSQADGKLNLVKIQQCLNGRLILQQTRWQIRHFWRLSGKGFREGQGASWCRPSSKVLAAPPPSHAPL